MKATAAVRFFSGAPGVAMRDVFGVVVVLGAGLAMMVSVCLIWLTSRLNDDAALIANAVESVRLGKSMERLITLHHRTDDRPARAKIGEEARRAVEQASRFLATSEERAVFESVRERVSEYLVAAKGGRHELEIASAAILRLVDLNVAHVTEIHGRMRRKNLFANALGGGAAALVLLV